MQPPPGALNAPLEKSGARPSWGQSAHTMGAAAPWAACLATTFGMWALLAGPRPSYVIVLAQV